MNYQILRKEILVALRGQRSQMQLSSKLRFGFNQVYRWESGQTRFMWGDFARLCRALKIDLASPLQSVLLYLGEPDDGAGLVEHLVRGTNLGETAKAIGVSRFKLQRWVSGDSDVPFEIVLAILQITDSLLGFVQRIVPLSQLASVAPLASRRHEIVKLLLDFPFLGGAMIMLELEAYKDLPTHRVGWIAERLGIGQREEVEALRRAEELGLLKKTGGKYVRTQDVLSTRNFPEIEPAMRAYWIQRGIAFDRIRPSLAANDRGYFGFLIVSLSIAQENQLRDAIVEFGNRVTAIAMQPSKGKTRMSVFNLQLYSPAAATDADSP